MPEPLIKNQYPGAAAGPPGPPGPPGPDVTGDPNGIVFINSAGDGSETSPDFTAAPLDPQGRPQIHDKRTAPGGGTIWRQGSWFTDGDPENIPGNGIVIYQPLGGPGGFDGNFARVKADRFGIRRIIGGVDIDYAYRTDLDGTYLKNDDAPAGVKTFEVDRAVGNLRASASIGVGAAGSEAKWYSGEGSPEGAQIGNPGDLYSNRLGGSNTSLYVKESGSGTNTGWTAK